jgi:hypothetical protein
MATAAASSTAASTAASTGFGGPSSGAERNTVLLGGVQGCVLLLGLAMGAVWG